MKPAKLCRMISKGYVGLFTEELTQGQITEFALCWLNLFDRVEQVYPGKDAGTATFTVHRIEDILWDKNLQFRVIAGDDFAWIYANLGQRVMETSGLPEAGNLAPLHALLELPGLEEIIDQANERRLDQLEAEGLL